MKIALIPARGGSKRIPHKNIKLFYGKPMIAYSIETAIESRCFDKIIVSTDDDKIAEIAIKYGAEVPFMRPSALSDDYATTMQVIQHAINYAETADWPLEALCCIYATAPFLQAQDIQLGLKYLQENDVQYAFTATDYAFPIQRAIKINQQQSVSMFHPQYLNTRSQDLEEAFHDAGQYYWGKIPAFKQALPIFSEVAKAILLPRKRVIDIDTAEDWEIAELMYQSLQMSL